MELEILHWITNLRCDWLNNFMIFISNLNNHGEIWILIAAIMLFFKKTRKCGYTMALSLIMMSIFGNVVLKNLFARPRPCWVDNTVQMLITAPTSYSFPSGHTFSSFAGAISIFFYNKKFGIVALLLASAIAFSRMYLFVHYPTDILGGIVFGWMVAIISYELINYLYRRRLKSIGK